MAVSCSFVAQSSSPTNASSYSLSLSFGTDDAGREIFVTVYGAGASALSVTAIGDDASPSNLVSQLSAGGGAVAIARGRPTGTSGNVAFTATGSIAGAAATYRVFNARQSGIITATDVSPVTPLDLSLNIPAGGAVIACGGNRNASGGSFAGDWPGTVTEDFNIDADTNEWFSGVSAVFGSAQSPLSLTVSPGAVGDGLAGVAVSIAPLVSLPLFSRPLRILRRR